MLPGFKVSNSWRFKQSELEQYISAQHNRANVGKQNNPENNWDSGPMAQLENTEAIEKRRWKAADTLRSNSKLASNVDEVDYGDITI